MPHILKLLVAKNLVISVTIIGNTIVTYSKT